MKSFLEWLNENSDQAQVIDKAFPGARFRQFLESRMSTVYHVSPVNNMKKIRAGRQRSMTKEHGRGVFVAPRFSDALAWADSFVKHKKPGGQYKNLTIYELEIPTETLRTLYHATWWEPEYMIPEELSDQIRIVSSRTLPNKEIVRLYRRSLNLKFAEKQGNELATISALAKTNLAARLYLDLFNSYAATRMGGRPEQNEIKDALERLKGMTRKPDRTGIDYDTVERLGSREEERLARSIHDRAIAGLSRDIAPIEPIT